VVYLARFHHSPGETEEIHENKAGSSSTKFETRTSRTESPFYNPASY
jgi:hypothetical protein